jgi:hypothetical protein
LEVVYLDKIPGALVDGSIIHREDDVVMGFVSQERWDKAKCNID